MAASRCLGHAACCCFTRQSFLDLLCNLSRASDRPGRRVAMRIMSVEPGRIERAEHVSNENYLLAA
jgi:hypothetical protein